MYKTDGRIDSSDAFRRVQWFTACDRRKRLEPNWFTNKKPIAYINWPNNIFFPAYAYQVYTKGKTAVKNTFVNLKFNTTELINPILVRWRLYVYKQMEISSQHIHVWIVGLGLACSSRVTQEGTKNKNFKFCKRVKEIGKCRSSNSMDFLCCVCVYVNKEPFNLCPYMPFQLASKYWRKSHRDPAGYKWSPRWFSVDLFLCQFRDSLDSRCQHASSLFGKKQNDPFLWKNSMSTI